MSSLDCSKLKIIKADKDILRSVEFDCGDEDLNEFLLEDSFINIDNSLSKIYLCLYENKVVAFFSLWVVGFCLELRKDIGVRFISVDAYNREKIISFYNYNLFEALQPERNKNKNNMPMYRDLCLK